MPDVLLVDAGFSARPLKQAAEALGHCVHTVGINAADALAAENPNHHLVDYSDVVAMTELVTRLNPDCVIPGCTDLSYEVCCQLTDLGVITGFEGSASLRHLHNKAAFRDLCSRCNVPAPQKFESVREALVASCPLVVKPTDAYSGRGITILETPTETCLAAAVNAARAVSRLGEVVIEQFIRGQLHSFSAFLCEGRAEQVFNVVEFGYANPLVVDTSYVVPATGVERELSKHTETLCGALGLSEGLFHVQYILQDGNPYFVEVTRRCPGDLYGELIHRATGFDYAGYYVGSFLGQSPPYTPSSVIENKQVVRHTVASQVDGHLESLQFSNAGSLKAWYPLAVSGAELAPSPRGRIGVAFFEVGSTGARDDLVERIKIGAVTSVRHSVRAVNFKHNLEQAHAE